MGFNIIKFIFFIYIITTYCLSTLEKFKYNNLKQIGDSEKFKRSLELYNDHYNLSDENIVQKRENNKRSINNTNDEVYREKRMITGDFLARWSLPIPYYIAPGVSHSLVEQALAMIRRETCIKFKKYRVMRIGISGIKFVRGDICSSPVGQQKGRIWQTILLAPSCEKVGRIQHETLHSLGLLHAHSRIDRNRYLYIAKENIKPGCRDEFRKVIRYDSATLGIPFDFGSVMMYPPTAFSKNGQDTIVTYDFRYKKTFGVADRISFADAKMLNKLYCFNVCRRKINCLNGGYQNPNNCKKCKCVLGYIGPHCNLLTQPSRLCGRSKLQASSVIKQFALKGNKECIFHVFAPKGKKIAIKVLHSEFTPNKERPCHIVNSLEIKYWTNKVSTGARFCNIQSNIMVYSENDHVIIYYRSRNPQNKFRILYKSIISNFNIKRVENDFSSYNYLEE